VHQRLRTFADDAHATLVRIFAYLCGLAALTAAAIQFVGEPLRLAAAAPTFSERRWIEVERPHQAFTLDMTEFGEADFGYAIRRHAAAGGRKDILRWDPSGASPSGMIEIYRPGDELARFGDAVTEISARISDLDVILPPTELGEVETKFGTMPLVDFVARTSTGLHQCAGLARGFGEPRVLIVGFMCNRGRAKVDRSQLACLVDRLTMMSGGGDDPKLGELFARAELKRTFCGHKDQLMAATPRHDWATGTIPNQRIRPRGRRARR